MRIRVDCRSKCAFVMWVSAKRLQYIACFYGVRDICSSMVGGSANNLSTKLEHAKELTRSVACAQLRAWRVHR